MCPPSYPHNGFVAAHAFGITYIYTYIYTHRHTLIYIYKTDISVLDV